MKQLKIGEVATVLVDACKWWNSSGILLEVGSTYDFEVPGNQKWNDWFIRTDADGYENAAAAGFKRWRRVASENWFKLIGTLGKDESTPIVIGKKRSGYSPKKEDELFCFANDIKLMYWNNCGKIRLTVTKVGRG